MRHAFDEVKIGREKDLNDAYLTFFAKRRELVKKYNDLNTKYIQIKKEYDRELDIKDKVIKTWVDRHAALHGELKLAKLIMSDPDLSKIALEDLHRNISDIEQEVLLKDNCIISDLLPEYWFQKKCFEVTNNKNNEKSMKFDKDKVKIVKSSI